MIEHTSTPPGVILVAVRHKTMSDSEARHHVSELERLVDTLGYRVLETRLLRGNTPHPGLFIGSGQADELASLADELEADALIFDDELSPSQQRNLERRTRVAVSDRHEIILEIFHEHAVTREARLQVEKAELAYQLPRLRRAWTHLSRQRGGMKGTRGEGETQLEIDRRRITARQQQLERELREVRRHRATMRQKREAVPVPTLALVGYTNAGKSSLMTALTGRDVLRQDKLFATLDPKSSRMIMPDGVEVIVTDTVGFIRKLPHDLVEAFRSTLEETVRADILLHVVDAASPQAADEVATTRAVLAEIGADTSSILVVLNKMDLLGYGGESIEHASIHVAGVDSGIPVSSLTGAGIASLRDRIADLVTAHRIEEDLLIPPDRWDLVAMVHREARVLQEDVKDGSVRLRAELSDRLRTSLAEYVV
ncbi:MAG: GTPase HflX [Spirochaetaceae bacterium]